MIRVILVEDDVDLRDDMAFNLRDEGMQVAACADGPALDRHLAVASADVVVLDIGLPGEDGLSIARRLRREQPRLGLILLTARTAPADRVRGMEDGADVYLGKPADLRELALVIRALSRRMHDASDGPDSMLTLLPRENRLRLPTGQTIELTPSEALLLSRLARAPGGQATRRQIIESFGTAYLDYDERRLEAIVSRLRKKLEAAGLPTDSLRAVRGIGYLLSVPLAERQGA